MKKTFFTVGPSQIYPTIPKHINNAIRNDILSISHRGSIFHEIYFENVLLLKKLLGIPSKYHIFFISSGTEAMELIINNTVKKKSFHLVTGSFGEKFFTIAKDLKKNAKRLSMPIGQSINREMLMDVNFSDYELLCVTENDTSSGVSIEMDNIYEIKKRNKNLLIAVDCVSSLPFANLKYKYLDCVFFSVQKGFGLPAGLGILVLSPDAFRKSEELLENKVNIGSYHNFSNLLSYAKKGEVPETPNVFAMYLLNNVLSDMLQYGIKKIRKETIYKSKLLYSYFEKNPQFKILVKENKIRSKTTIVVETNRNSNNLISFCKTKGFLVGSGYGSNKEKHIRIGNFPAHSILDVEMLIKTMKEFSNKE